MSITLIGKNYRRNVTLGTYSDDTPMVKVDDFAGMCSESHTMVVNTSSLAVFTTAMFLVDSINSNDGWIQTLVLPYVPGARQDRSNPTGDVLQTAASVAGMINARNFGSVVILDPHSPVTPRLITRSREYPLAKVASMMPEVYDGVIAPDKGAEARGRAFADELGLPVFYGGKTRDVATGRLSGFTLDEIPAGHYLVVDDICDGGGTFIGLAEKIKQAGSTADLYVTHGIFSKGVTDLHKIYKNIYTTDSMDSVPEGIYVIPIVEDM